MTAALPAPEQLVALTLKNVQENTHQYVYAPLDRILADSPYLEREALIAGLDAFHRDRMAMTPSATTYPEAGPWVDLVRQSYALLQDQGGLTDHELALLMSLKPYVLYRGFREGARQQPVTEEKCRAVFHPNTDRGRLCIKCLDDPATFWKRQAPPRKLDYPGDRLGMDGAGNGLHVDDEPDELFPLPIDLMRVHLGIEDVPGAVEFFTRYKLFWFGGNRVLHDAQGRSVGVEKGSAHHIAVYEPGDDRSSHISGMVARDPQSPLGKHMRAKRDEYLALFHQPADGIENCYWQLCDEAEVRLADGLAKLGPNPKAQDIFDWFVAPWPEGFNKTGKKYHPDQPYIQYTLMIHATLIDERKMLRWQRDEDDLSWPAEPEIFQF